jgi:integrase
MSEEQQKINKLRDAIKRIVSDIEKAEHEGNVEEIAEEVEDEFKRDLGLYRPKGSKLGQKLPIPSPLAIISYDSDGKTILTRFFEDEWRFFQREVIQTFKFRHESELNDLNLKGELANHLVHFSKICGWFMLPGNNPCSGVYSTHTSILNMIYFRTLVAFLLKRGFLLNIANTEPKPLSMLNVADLKAELRKNMEDNRPSIHVAGLFRAVGNWVQLADTVELPAEFKPSFTIRDWQGDKKILKEVIRYEAEKVTPWKDIPYDDLIRLLQESQVYVQDYSDDILFMTRKVYIELNDFLNGTKKPGVFKTGKTKPIFDAFVNHEFVADPRTGAPWFALLVTRTKTNKRADRERIFLGQCRTEESRLMTCCIFLLLFWTAMRVEELLHLKVDGLFINEKRLGRETNAVEAFKQSKGTQGTFEPKFDLEFLTFKTTKNKKGKLRKIPLTEDAAHAFCIVVELFRAQRSKLENSCLFPNGGIKQTNLRKNPKAPATRLFIANRLANLCEKVGAERHHPHKCRKSLATIIINKNANSLDLIQRLLGHQTPNMTLRYLMKIPGVAKAIHQHLIASNRKRILDLLTAAATRRMSGNAGERMMKAIPHEKLAAEVLPDTVEEYIDVLLADPNFVVIKTAMAWCLRFRSLRPQQLPCLPVIGLIDVPPEDLAPDPSNCRPWACGYAAHTSRHLKRVRDNRDASRKLAGAAGIRAELVQSFSFQAEYWENVVRHLEQGHENFQEIVPAAVFNSGV